MKADRPGRKARSRVDGERLKGYREKLKMTQEDFVDRCDVELRTIQRGERGEGWETDTYEAVAAGISRMLGSAGFGETVTPEDLQKNQGNETRQ